MVRPPTKGLTPRQSETLDWIKTFIHEHKMPPTVREIGRGLGINSSTVFAFLKELERKGFVKRGNLGARSLTVTGLEADMCQKVPVTGRLAPGQHIKELQVEDFVRVCTETLNGRDGFAVRVAAEGRVHQQILEGGYLIVRKQSTAEDGDFVVARIHGRVALKRFRLIDGKVLLESTDEVIEPIHSQQGEFLIEGKVVAIYRKLETD